MCHKRSVFCLFLFLLVVCDVYAQDRGAPSACPTANPADTDKVGEIDEREKRRWLLCICGERQSAGGYRLIDADKAANFLLLVNDNFLARYDEDCSGDLEQAEKDEYLADQRAGLDKKIADARDSAAKRAEYRITSWRKSIENDGGYISERASLGVLSNPPLSENKISLGYTLNVDSAQEVEYAQLGFSVKAKQFATPLSNSRVATAFAVDLSWKETDSDEASSVTRAADLLPISFSISPIESLKFTSSAGISYFETEELDIETGIKEAAEDWAFAYKLGISYQTNLPCLSFGVEYKIRTNDVFGQRLSYEWLPVASVNLLKPCFR